MTSRKLLQSVVSRENNLINVTSKEMDILFKRFTSKLHERFEKTHKIIDEKKEAAEYFHKRVKTDFFI